MRAAMEGLSHGAIGGPDLYKSRGDAYLTD
jgi:hypothetical protein